MPFPTTVLRELGLDPQPSTRDGCNAHRDGLLEGELIATAADLNAVLLERPALEGLLLHLAELPTHDGDPKALGDLAVVLRLGLSTSPAEGSAADAARLLIERWRNDCDRAEKPLQALLAKLRGQAVRDKHGVVVTVPEDFARGAVKFVSSPLNPGRYFSCAPHDSLTNLNHPLSEFKPGDCYRAGSLPVLVLGSAVPGPGGSHTHQDFWLTEAAAKLSAYWAQSQQSHEARAREEKARADAEEHARKEAREWAEDPRGDRRRISKLEEQLARLTAAAAASSGNGR
jgi:hypothetical protein